MKPMKYNYKERKLKKRFMGKYTVLYRTYVVFIAFLIDLSFSVFHFSERGQYHHVPHNERTRSPKH